MRKLDQKLTKAVPQGQAPAKKAREQNPPSELEQGDRAISTAIDSYGYPFEAMQGTSTNPTVSPRTPHLLTRINHSHPLHLARTTPRLLRPLGRQIRSRATQPAARRLPRRHHARRRPKNHLQPALPTRHSRSLRCRRALVSPTSKQRDRRTTPVQRCVLPRVPPSVQPAALVPARRALGDAGRYGRGSFDRRASPRAASSREAQSPRRLDARDACAAAAEG